MSRIGEPGRRTGSKSRQFSRVSQLDDRLPRHAAITHGTGRGSASILGRQHRSRIRRTVARRTDTASASSRPRATHVALQRNAGSSSLLNWWTNAAVRVTDDSRMLYPMRFTASHGFRAVDTWPSTIAAWISPFARTPRAPYRSSSHGSREGFMGVYHPATDSGVVPPTACRTPREESLVVGRRRRMRRTGASRPRTTTAPTSRSRRGCSVTRRPTPSSNRRRRSLRRDRLPVLRHRWPRARDTRRRVQSVAERLEGASTALTLGLT